MILSASTSSDSCIIGGKARALVSLTRAGFRIPQWQVIPPGCCDLPTTTSPVAVRSSAIAEDGNEHSFAGQLDSFLNVAPADLADRIAAVRASAHSERLRAYSTTPGDVAVIVQEMVDAKYAGVAFSADPITGIRARCVISAVAGLGERLVSGEVDGEQYAHHLTKGIGAEPQNSLLTREQVIKVAGLARDCARHFGRPQDIEWAIDQHGTLWLLQSRAITTLAGLPDPEDPLTVWDNSNIAESYGDVTTPMTFSFASRVYEHVYREFCKLLSVPDLRIEDNADVFPQMLGLIRGRTYYNLASWYRVLALLPGFSSNRTFMEKMMGLKQPLPTEIVASIIAENKTAKWRDRLHLARTSFSLICSFFGLHGRIRRFRQRLDAALELSTPLYQLTHGELIAHYRDLESQLLHKWDAPLINDFFAMIFYGLLSKRVGNCNENLRNVGDVISARPPRLIKEMAAIAAEDPALLAILKEPKAPLWEKRAAIRKNSQLETVFAYYLAEFGDRCLDELKLESHTVDEDPTSLIASIGAFATRSSTGEAVEDLQTTPPKGRVNRWLLRRTQDLIRNRENLRFERTRVFGRVRKILREIGRRLTADGALNHEDDIFYLKIEEALDQTSTSLFKDIVAARRAEFAGYHESPAPPDRFETRGSLHRYHHFSSTVAETATPSADMQGIGACPGIVRGPVRIVSDPRDATLLPGEILVAKQTDPGWVVLFPAATGLLVERGSILSHSAIVARELGLPCIVSLTGITTRLQTGDQVEMNGQTGQITRIVS